MLSAVQRVLERPPPTPSVRGRGGKEPGYELPSATDLRNRLEDAIKKNPDLAEQIATQICDCLDNPKYLSKILQPLVTYGFGTPNAKLATCTLFTDPEDDVDDKSMMDSTSSTTMNFLQTESILTVLLHVSKVQDTLLDAMLARFTDIFLGHPPEAEFRLGESLINHLTTFASSAPVTQAQLVHDKLVEALPSLLPPGKRLVLQALPSTVRQETSEATLSALLETVADSQELFPEVLDSVATITALLPPEMAREAFERFQDNLPGVPHEVLAPSIRLLLTNVPADLLSSAIQTVRKDAQEVLETAVFRSISINSSSSGSSSSSSTSSSSRSNDLCLELVEAFSSAVRLSIPLSKHLLASLQTQPADKQLDFWLWFVLFASPLSRAAAVSAFLAQLRARVIQVDALRRAVQARESVIDMFFYPLLSTIPLLLSAAVSTTPLMAARGKPKRTTVKQEEQEVNTPPGVTKPPLTNNELIAAILQNYSAVFMTTKSPHLRQHLLSQMIGHLGDATVAAGVLDELSNLTMSRPELMREFTSTFRGIFDLLSELPRPLLRKAYGVLSHVGFAAESDSGTHSEIMNDIFVNLTKTLTSNTPVFQDQGVVGAVALLSVLHRGRKVKARAEDEVRTRRGGSLWDLLHRSFAQSPRVHAAFLQEITALLLTDLRVRKSLPEGLHKEVNDLLFADFIIGSEDDDDTVPSLATCAGKLAIRLPPTAVLDRLPAPTLAFKGANGENHLFALYPRLLSIKPADSQRLVLLGPALRLLCECHVRTHGSFKEIDGLLEIPMLVPSTFVSPSTFPDPLALAALVHIVNTLRDILSGFSRLWAPEDRGPLTTCVYRIAHTEDLVYSLLSRVFAANASTTTHNSASRNESDNRADARSQAVATAVSSTMSKIGGGLQIAGFPTTSTPVLAPYKPLPVDWLPYVAPDTQWRALVEVHLRPLSLSALLPLLGPLVMSGDEEEEEDEVKPKRRHVSDDDDEEAEEAENKDNSGISLCDPYTVRIPESLSQRGEDKVKAEIVPLTPSIFAWLFTHFHSKFCHYLASPATAKDETRLIPPSLKSLMPTIATLPSTIAPLSAANVSQSSLPLTLASPVVAGIAPTPWHTQTELASAELDALRPQDFLLYSATLLKSIVDKTRSQLATLKDDLPPDTQPQTQVQTQPEKPSTRATRLSARLLRQCIAALLQACNGTMNQYFKAIGCGTTRGTVGDSPIPPALLTLWQALSHPHPKKSESNTNTWVKATLDTLAVIHEDMLPALIPFPRDRFECLQLSAAMLLFVRSSSATLPVDVHTSKRIDSMSKYFCRNTLDFLAQGDVAVDVSTESSSVRRARCALFAAHEWHRRVSALVSLLLALHPDPLTAQSNLVYALLRGLRMRIAVGCESGGDRVLGIAQACPVPPVVQAAMEKYVSAEEDEKEDRRSTFDAMPSEALVVAFNTLLKALVDRTKTLLTRLPRGKSKAVEEEGMSAEQLETMEDLATTMSSIADLSQVAVESSSSLLLHAAVLGNGATLLKLLARAVGTMKARGEVGKGAEKTTREVLTATQRIVRVLQPVCAEGERISGQRKGAGAVRNRVPVAQSAMELYLVKAQQGLGGVVKATGKARGIDGEVMEEEREREQEEEVDKEEEEEEEEKTSKKRRRSEKKGKKEKREKKESSNGRGKRSKKEEVVQNDETTEDEEEEEEEEAEQSDLFDNDDEEAEED